MRSLNNLLKNILSCRECEASLPLGPRPMLSVSESSIILIAGQAPGKKVHQSGVPWDDISGDRLRAWLGVNSTTFYDNTKIALVPMGFCYPGTGKSGDLPPRKECQQIWHSQLLKHLTNIKLTILVGKYAQDYHLGNNSKKNLTQTVLAWREFAPTFYPIPHSSPRNQIWLKRNPWFESELLPKLKQTVIKVLDPNVNG